MNTVLLGIVLLALMNATFKAIGPAILSGRRLPAWFDWVLRALGQGLLASLVVVTLLGAGWSAFDPTVLPGLALALGLRMIGQSHLVCALSAVVLTGVVRTIT